MCVCDSHMLRCLVARHQVIGAKTTTNHHNQFLSDWRGVVVWIDTHQACTYLVSYSSVLTMPLDISLPYLSRAAIRLGPLAIWFCVQSSDCSLGQHISSGLHPADAMDDGLDGQTSSSRHMSQLQLASLTYLCASVLQSHCCIERRLV